MIRVLFVCLGNICRSDRRFSTFVADNHLVGANRVEVDSAGTAAWHGNRQTRMLCWGGGLNVNTIYFPYVHASQTLKALFIWQWMKPTWIICKPHRAG